MYMYHVYRPTAGAAVGFSTNVIKCPWKNITHQRTGVLPSLRYPGTLVSDTFYVIMVVDTLLHSEETRTKQKMSLFY